MKTYFYLTICFTMLRALLFAQTPNLFQYQAVVRDASGTALVNQPVNFQVSIISGSITGTVEYIETHTASTNAFGIVTLTIGNGIPVTGTFVSVNWGSASHYIKVEADPTGGTSYLDMGTTQLLSVPYALYAETAGNAGQTYSAGNGIDITGTVITNTSPDQVVNITSGPGVQVTGTYPDFTIENTQPDQAVNLTGAGSTSVTGTYPNYTITSTGGTVPYTAGSGIDITGTTVSNTAPDQTVTLTQGGATTISGTYPNFTISSTDNNTTYTAGTGIDVTGTTITNTSPNATHTGDVTGSTALTIANNAVTTTKIADGNVTAVKLNSMSATNGQVLKYNGVNWAPATDANTTYTAGTGINVTGTTITNTSPDQTVTLNQGGATTISGTYPNFTISSTDNNTTYTAGTGMTLTGTTFDAQTTTALWNASQLQGKAISSTAPAINQILKYNGTSWALAADNNTTYTAGTGINITGTTITNTAPDQTVTLTQGGATTISGTYPNFTVSSTDLNTGTPGGLNKTVQYNNNGVFAGDTAAMVWDNANKRLGIGTSNPLGRVVIKGSATAPANEPLFEIKNKLGQQIMVVYEDSVHFFITDAATPSNRGGFAVSGRNNAKAVTNNYLSVRPDSTRIYTGDTIAGFGVENIGSSNDSYLHLTQYNSFIGNLAGHNNVVTGSNGIYNNYIGYYSGYANISGRSNVFLGHQAGLNSTASYDVFIGNESGTNSTGAYNVFIGDSSGYANLAGNNNMFLGYRSGKKNTSGTFNMFMGSQAGINNTTGTNNIFIGYNSGAGNSTGTGNIYIGQSAGLSIPAGQNNTCIGTQSGMLASGSRNVFIGYQAGYSEAGNDKLYINNSNATLPLITGDFVTRFVKINGYFAKTVGAAVASAATITPTGMIFHVTGTTAITTINLPYAGFTGSITIIPDAAFTTGTAGNIAVTTNAAISKAITFTYDGTKWYPSY